MNQTCNCTISVHCLCLHMSIIRSQCCKCSFNILSTSYKLPPNFPFFDLVFFFLPCFLYLAMCNSCLSPSFSNLTVFGNPLMELSIQLGPLHAYSGLWYAQKDAKRYLPEVPFGLKSFAWNFATNFALTTNIWPIGYIRNSCIGLSPFARDRLFT